MAVQLDEDKLKKPDGNIITRSGIVDSSIKYYQQAYQEELTNITDFSQGSEIRTLHESIAVELFDLYVETERQAKMKFVRYASGSYLDEIACEYHLTRKPAEVATGSVVFSTSATVNGVIVVPKDTIILDVATGYEYVLESDIYITAPDTPVNGTVHSKLVGSKYNAPIDRLRTFQDLSSIRSEIKVTNSTEITNGRDGETDEELRERILNAKREKAWGTATAYSNLIQEEVTDVRDVQFVDPEALLEDDSYPRHFKSYVTEDDTYSRDSNGTILKDEDGNPKVMSLKELISNDLICTDCTCVLFVNAASKPCPDDTLDQVEYVMTQQNNLVVGQKFHIERAKPVKVFFDIEIFVTASINEDILFDHLMGYFDGGDVTSKTGNKHYNGLSIGETLYKSKLIDVLEDIPSVYQVGHIKQIKYNSKLPEYNLNEWHNDGANGWSYEDDEGYTYTRTSSSDTKTINHWGSKNFTYLETGYGTVFQLGQKKELDSSTEDVFTITQVPVDEKGKILVTLENEEE